MMIKPVCYLRMNPEIHVYQQPAIRLIWTIKRPLVDLVQNDQHKRLREILANLNLYTLANTRNDLQYLLFLTRLRTDCRPTLGFRQKHTPKF